MFLRDLLQPMHIIVIVGIYLMFFGTTKLPEFGKSLGEGLKGFKNAIREGSDPDAKVEAKPAVAGPAIQSSVAENIPGASV